MRVAAAGVRFEVDLGDDESIRPALTAALTSSARQGARLRGGSIRRHWAEAPSWIGRSRSTHPSSRVLDLGRCDASFFARGDREDRGEWQYLEPVCAVDKPLLASEGYEQDRHGKDGSTDREDGGAEEPDLRRGAASEPSNTQREGDGEEDDAGPR
jgi:hypothetical protein